MSKKRKASVKQTVGRRRISGRLAAAGLTLALALAGAAFALRGPGTIATHYSPAPQPLVSQPGFPPTSPAKEYIYAGGRLVATEEPTGAPVLPIAPSNLRADFNSKLLGWTDNSANELGFKIEQHSQMSGGWSAWSQIATVGADVTSYPFFIKGKGCEEWRVRAYNAVGDSPYSNSDGACPTATGGTTYDAVADFSSSQNPGGPWSYGYRAAGGGAFAPLTSNSNIYGLPAGMHTWYLPGVWNLPGVIHNGTGVSQSYFGATQPTTLLNLYPGANGEQSIVRWTAQGPGTAQIAGRFEGLDSTTTGVSIVKNGTTTLFSGNVSGFGNQAPFSLSSLTVATGDTIEFQVYYNGDIQHDSTGLAAAITLQ